MKSRSLISSAVLIFLCLTFYSNAQVQTPRYNSIIGNCGGYYEYLPQGYNSGTQTYPLIVFLHGIGEEGNGTTDLPNLLNCWTALPRLIANGAFPASFNVGGQNFSFIVISPQFKWWPGSADVNAIVDYAVQNYRVDQSRIYVTGLSMGGGAVWDFAAAYPTKAAAIVPVCGASYPDVARGQVLGDSKLPVWATHNQDDPTVSSSNTTGWVNNINQYGGNAQMTIFPASGHDAWTKTYDPNFTQNGVNIYQWMLQHQKGSSSPNQPPTVNAGQDQTITLPASSVTLSATANDPDGSIASYQWTQVSGPSQAGIASATAAQTLVSSLVQGSYTFRLTVTDNKGATASDDVIVTVNAAPNQPPTVNAGQDQTITLPASSVTLSATANDPDGSIASYQWTQVSGPSQAGIASATAAQTLVSSLVQGSYTFRLTVTDNKGATASDDVIVTVNAAPNQPPTVNAGQDQTITLPASSVTLSATANDPDGSIASYQWTQVSGPSQANFSDAISATSLVSQLKRGIYVFRLTVTDNRGAAAWDEVTITVNPAPNQLPIANAGSDQTITLPTNSVDLSGFAFDPDGRIVSNEWTQISGPTKSSFSSASPLAVTVHNLVEGIYTFRLTVTDNDGGTNWDDVKVMVMPDPRTRSTATLYPNPAIDLINVKIDALTLQSNSVVRIINSAGNEVYTENFARTDFRMIKQIDVSKLPSGVYFLSVTADINTTTTLKFVKK